MGVIHKYARSDFVILDPPLPCTCTYAFSLHPLPPITSVRIVFFKEGITAIYFANYYQSKNHKQRYKIKKLLYKAIRKWRIRTQRRALRIELALFNCTGRRRREWIILAIWIAHFIFYFVTNLRKKLMAYVHLQLNLFPSPHSYTSQYAFSWTTPPPSERTYFMDELERN